MPSALLEKNNTRTGIILAFLLLLILALGLCLRLFDLTDQPIDFHPTRQLRGAIIARGMYYEMLPSADENIRQKAITFWQSTGQYEPSILERIVAITYLFTNGERIWIARIYNSLFWLIGGIALFALAQRMTQPENISRNSPETRVISFWGALLALTYYLALPFSVQASRSFQPDPGMVMWILLCCYFLYRWVEKPRWIWAIGAGLCAGMAVLTKAVGFYIVSGAMIAMVTQTIVYQRPKPLFPSVISIIKNPQVWVMALLIISPSALYYLGREGRASEYISSWTIALSHLLLETWFYLRWANLVQNLMGFLTLLLAFVGILLARHRNRALLIGLWIGYIAYGLFLPYQMYTHNYYHLQLIPIVALSLVPVFYRLIKFILGQKRVWQILIAGLAMIAIFYLAWLSLIPMRSRDYRSESKYWQDIASYIPSDGKVIALTQDYGYRLMYYGWRKVTLWPNRGERKLTELRGSDKEFQEFFAKRTKDKRYFLITAFKQFDDQPILKQTLYDHYSILSEGHGYIIFDLGKPKDESTG